MRGASRRLYVHIGLHKTGTTFLQGLLAANADALQSAGIHFPGGAQDGGVVQYRSANDLLGQRPRGYNDPRIDGAWKALVTAVRRRHLPTALLSRENFSLGKAAHARRLAASFPDREVHVIVTVRDLGRALVSFWQQHVRDDNTWTWNQFAEAVRDPDRSGVNPARAFWGAQDLPRICATWEAAVPPERLHIVTVPPPGRPPTELVDRFASVVGFDAGILTTPAPRTNENVGVAALEMIRQVNRRMGRRVNELAYTHLVRDTLVPVLTGRSEPARPVLPPEEVGWVSARADEMIAAITQRGYPVAGSLDDLRVAGERGRRPDDATPAEVLEAALDALAGLAEALAADLARD